MAGVVVVGSMWGDEGKGKVTDYLGYRNAVEADDQTRQRVQDNNGTVCDGDGHGFDGHAYQ